MTPIPHRVEPGRTPAGRVRRVRRRITLPQDFTLFILMQEKNIDIWKKKLDWLADKGGMALVNTHSDYMIFNDNKPKIEEYPAKYYEEFFKYVKKK
jgi:hypothetical protein